MKDVTIRKFEHTDVDAFIHLSQVSFAEESIAAGITPEDFESETRRIFRWKMLPYKLLTALMGVKWEAFVAEKDGKVVGGGMYIGRDNRMTITNLMVDPEYRRQGIGKALLATRLERIAGRGFPYALAQVLKTNQASLGNLKKQGFEVFNRYSVYERALPVSEAMAPDLPPVTLREITPSDRRTFTEIEKTTTPAGALSINGSLKSRYFPSRWRKLYARFAGYSTWIKTCVAQGKTIGFIYAQFHRRQSKGFLLQPVIADEHLSYLPGMIGQAVTWLDGAGKESVVVEIPDHCPQIGEYLLREGWSKKRKWLELVRWLDERAKQEFEER